MSVIGEPPFEAALNLLREEGRAVKDRVMEIRRDEALKAEAPAHRLQLLDQALAEMRQIGRAVSVLEAIQADDGLMPALHASPRPVAMEMALPARVSGLARKPVLPVIGRMAP